MWKVRLQAFQKILENSQTLRISSSTRQTISNNYLQIGMEIFEIVHFKFSNYPKNV